MHTIVNTTLPPEGSISSNLMSVYFFLKNPHLLLSILNSILFTVSLLCAICHLITLFLYIPQVKEILVFGGGRKKSHLLNVSHTSPFWGGRGIWQFWGAG